MTKTDVNNEIRALALELSLSVDEQAGGHLCPICLGGISKEKSLSVYRSSFSVSYKCHRASCGVGGKVVFGKGQSDSKHIPKKEPPRFFGRLTEIPASVSEILSNKYELCHKMASKWDLRWAPDEDGGKGRLWIPVLNSDQTRIGAVLRTLDKKIFPKTKTFMEEDWYPCMSTYKGDLGHTLKAAVIVEDQLSAIKTSEVAMRSFALLGTHIDVLKAKTISSLCKGLPLIYCLDGDAFKKATELRRTWAPLLGNTYIVKPKKDLKDTPYQDIRKLLSEVLPKEQDL